MTKCGPTLTEWAKNDLRQNASLKIHNDLTRFVLQNWLFAPVPSPKSPSNQTRKHPGFFSWWRTTNWRGFFAYAIERFVASSLGIGALIRMWSPHTTRAFSSRSAATRQRVISPPACISLALKSGHNDKSTLTGGKTGCPLRIRCKRSNWVRVRSKARSRPAFVSDGETFTMFTTVTRRVWHP